MTTPSSGAPRRSLRIGGASGFWGDSAAWARRSWWQQRPDRRAGVRLPGRDHHGHPGRRPAQAARDGLRHRLCRQRDEAGAARRHEARHPRGGQRRRHQPPGLRSRAAGAGGVDGPGAAHRRGRGRRRVGADAGAARRRRHRHVQRPAAARARAQRQRLPGRVSGGTRAGGRGTHRHHRPRRGQRGDAGPADPRLRLDARRPRPPGRWQPGRPHHRMWLPGHRRPVHRLAARARLGAHRLPHRRMLRRRQLRALQGPRHRRAHRAPPAWPSRCCTRLATRARTCCPTWPATSARCGWKRCRASACA
jgi:hypothetical protein